MKKLALIILCFIPLVNAWEWNTHQRLAENTYYSFPIELQTKLNLSLIREGSIAPDKVFHDNRLHHYPPSYNLSLKWINLTLYHYNNKDYNNASYSFGVLSHYIVDSFSSPHNVAKEDSRIHSQFESQIKNYKQKTKCNDLKINLKEELQKASENKRDWEPYLLSKDPLIPQEESEQAQKTLYSLSTNLFNVSCLQATTKIESIPFNLTTLMFSGAIILTILFLLINLFKD